MLNWQRVEWWGQRQWQFCWCFRILITKVDIGGTDFQCTMSSLWMGLDFFNIKPCLASSVMESWRHLWVGGVYCWVWNIEHVNGNEEIYSTKPWCVCKIKHLVKIIIRSFFFWGRILQIKLLGEMNIEEKL